MIHELGTELQVAAGQTPKDALWEHLGFTVAVAKPGKRVKTGEYMSWPRCTLELLSSWTQNLFKLEVTGLEHDQLGSKFVRATSLAGARLAAHADEAALTTSTQVTSVETKILRGDHVLILRAI